MTSFVSLSGGENVHEHTSSKVKSVYPYGMHAAIAAGLLKFLPSARVTTATLQEPPSTA